MRLFLHPSHRIEKNDTKPIFGAIILFPADSDFSLHCQELISPSLLLLLTVLLSICLLASTPPSLPLNYCCHLSFALHGFWLQPRGNFTCSTEFTYKHTRTNMHVQKGRRKGGEKNLPLEDLFIKCAVKSCQAFHIRAHFPASGYLKERIQTWGRHNAISTTFTTVYFSYSKYSEPWMCTYGDHFIWIVNSCYWCWCQGFARRQIIRHRPRNLLMLQKNASL